MALLYKRRANSIGARTMIRLRENDDGRLRVRENVVYPLESLSFVRNTTEVLNMQNETLRDVFNCCRAQVHRDTGLG